MFNQIHLSISRWTSTLNLIVVGYIKCTQVSFHFFLWQTWAFTPMNSLKFKYDLVPPHIPPQEYKRLPNPPVANTEFQLGMKEALSQLKTLHWSHLRNWRFKMWNVKTVESLLERTLKGKRNTQTARKKCWLKCLFLDRKWPHDLLGERREEKKEIYWSGWIHCNLSESWEELSIWKSLLFCC